MTFDLNATMLAGTTTAQRQAWLVEAQTAYAQLITGGKPVSVSYEGKAVSFSAAEAASLQNWIGLLLASLGLGKRRRAMRLVFR